MKKKIGVIVTFSDKKVSKSEIKIANMKLISIFTNWRIRELSNNTENLSIQEKDELRELKLFEFALNSGINKLSKNDKGFESP